MTVVGCDGAGSGQVCWYAAGVIAAWSSFGNHGSGIPAPHFPITRLPGNPVTWYPGNASERLVTS